MKRRLIGPRLFWVSLLGAPFLGSPMLGTPMLGSLLLGASSQSLVAAESEPMVLSDRGIIQQLDFENNTMVVGGMQFVVPLDTPVTLRNAAGAFTMLVVGMKAEVVYKEFPTERVAMTVDQLPDNTEIEES